MGLFSRDKEYHLVTRLHDGITNAFDHVKRDISHAFSWIHYFQKKHQNTDERLAKIENQLQTMPKTHQEIKQVVDYYYSYDQILSKMHEVTSRLDSLEQQKQEKRIGIRERLVKKITKNSKDYVKTVIISLIKKYNRITAPQLKEILVEEQGLCSKSSFYRLLNEIDQEGEVEVIQLGKEKAYLTKSAVEN